MDPKVIEAVSQWKDPLGYPWTTYVWVIAVAGTVAGFRHLNSMKRFRLGKLLLDIGTAGVTGVITFWLCEARDIHGPMSAVAIAVAGAMGNRFWSEIENIWRIKFGLKKPEYEEPQQ